MSDRPLRVLVVDDHQAIREVAALALGPGTVTASSMADALEALIEGDPFDAVVMDIHLAGESGKDLASWIRSQRPELRGRVLLMTGDATYIGPDVLAKPFRMNELVARVRDVMRQSPDAPLESN